MEHKMPTKKDVRERLPTDTRTQSDAGSHGNGRAAGPEAMVHPDQSWDLVAEASDESFPCSDPPSWSGVSSG
jgi:hypothetical protein